MGRPVFEAVNYYNEHDPKAAAWLRGLIEAGEIPQGIVDERSIEDIAPSDLDGFTQCHFFAGIGGWPLAFRLAGWPDDRPAWTGSCPCQPFSQAGEGKGTADERHLWPAFFWLIRQRNPSIVFGEQVASKDGREWLAGVRVDLEDVGYAVGAADLCAAGVGAPHIRQRLYWMAYARHGQRGRESKQQSGAENAPEWHKGAVDAERCSEASRMAHNGSGTRKMESVNDCRGPETHGVGKTGEFGSCSAHGRLGDTEREQHERRGGIADMGCPADQEQGEARQWQQGRLTNGSGLVLSDCDGCEPGCSAASTARHGDSAITTSFWSEYQLVQCRDGKTRRIAPEPALFPLVDGLPYQVARRRSIIAPLTRGPGNAIVPQVAAIFIEAARESIA